MPLKGLLSDGFAAERRALIDPNHAATSPVPPGDPYPYNPGEAAATAEQSETTTHLSVSDRWGNVVSYTYTIESSGGNGVVVPGWGFLLNNELTDFNFDSLTHPNRVEGGKRPRSSISPTIVLDDGRPFLALGSPGGSMIITTVLQILVDRLDLGATLPEAIAAPRASQRNTLLTAAEPAFISSPEGQALVARFGHGFSTTAEIGASTGIEFLGGGRVLAAGSHSVVAEEAQWWKSRNRASRHREAGNALRPRAIALCPVPGAQRAAPPRPDRARAEAAPARRAARPGHRGRLG